MNTSNETIAQSNNSTKVVIRTGEFSGAFAKFQVSAYYDLKRAGFDTTVAHKVAFDFGSDIGNAIRNADDDALAAKVGKAKKDGSGSITLSGGGATTTSRTMSIIRLCQQTYNLHKEGLLKSCKVEMDNLSQNLTEYVEKCELWASEQEFSA